MLDLLLDVCTILLRDRRPVQTQAELINLSLDVCHLVRNVETGDLSRQHLLFNAAVDVFLDLLVIEVLVL